MTVAEVLALARQRGVDRLDAQLLLGDTLGRRRSWLLAHDDAAISETGWAELDARLQRRAEGEPLAYLLGEKEFRGLSFHVTPAVLIPRPATETLVEWALELLAPLPPSAQPELLDMGTGSGAIALSVKHACPRARVTALDLSEEALEVARDNGQRLSLAVEWLQSDWWSAVEGRRFDLILANPPYIAEGDPHLPALAHEPRNALTSGADGLDALRILISGAAGHLRPGAWLLVEHGYDQAEAVGDLLRGAGLTTIEQRRDLSGQPRCSGGRR